MARPYTPKTGPLAGISFPTQQAYQNRLAQTRGYASYAEMRREGTQRFKPPSWFERIVRENFGKPQPAGYQKITKAGYARHLRAVRAEFRQKGVNVNRPGGALAQLLEFLGVRVSGANYAVGATP